MKRGHMQEYHETTGTVDGWERAGDRLLRTFEFQSFADAIAFVVKASGKIEQMDHHPEWQNVNRRLHVELTTHNTCSITQLDEELALHLNALYTAFHEGIVTL